MSKKDLTEKLHRGKTVLLVDGKEVFSTATTSERLTLSISGEVVYETESLSSTQEDDSGSNTPPPPPPHDGN